MSIHKSVVAYTLGTNHGGSQRSTSSSLISSNVNRAEPRTEEHCTHTFPHFDPQAKTQEQLKLNISSFGTLFVQQPIWFSGIAVVVIPPETELPVQI